MKLNQISSRVICFVTARLLSYSMSIEMAYEKQHKKMGLLLLKIHTA
jgi:hypothetical protein